MITRKADMDNPLFEHPVLNAPYQYPMRHWELDDQGQPTQQIIESRRRAEFITPIPKPRKRKGSAGQQSLIFDEGKGLSSQAQQYDPTPVINALHRHVDEWRSLPNPASWRVTPETARLLEHWRHHPFNNIRPFFCQVEAVETVIWLSEVAPNAGKAGKDEQDWSELVVHAPPLYIQGKVHSKVLIDDLLRQTEQAQAQQPGFQIDLFANFNGLPDESIRTEFYRHDANWTNRMILGDEVMKVLRV